MKSGTSYGKPAASIRRKSLGREVWMGPDSDARRAISALQEWEPKSPGTDPAGTGPNPLARERRIRLRNRNLPQIPLDHRPVFGCSLEGGFLVNSQHARYRGFASLPPIDTPATSKIHIDPRLEARGLRGGHALACGPPSQARVRARVRERARADQRPYPHRSGRPLRAEAPGGRSGRPLRLLQPAPFNGLIKACPSSRTASHQTLTTIFPKCSPAAMCSKAAGSLRRGKTRSMTGRRRWRAMARFIASKLSRWPTRMP